MVQTAVSASTLTPGVYVKVNLLAGAGAAGSGSLNLLLIAPKSSAGDLTVDTEIRAGTGPDSASQAFGPGTPGHLAAKLLYAKDQAALVDFCAPTAGATAATLNVTLTGSPGADTALTWTIHGRVVQSLWLNGQTADQGKATAISAINSITTDCSVVASSGGTGVVTITFKVTGKIGNDCLVQAGLAAAQTGTEAVAGAATPTPLAGGTTDFDATSVLAAAAGKEYHFIGLCSSNADYQSASSSSNPSKVAAKIGTLNSGLNAKLQQCVIWSTGAQSAAKTGAIHLNNPVFEAGDTVNGQSLPAEFVGREMGARSASDKIDPAANRIGEVLDGLFCSFQPVTDNLTLAASEDALHNGVTPTAYTANLTPYVVRPITSYSQDPSGANDVRCLDVQNVSATYIIARDIRDNLPLAFPNAKIMKNAASNSEPPDIEGITEERDVFGWVADRLRQWARKGVADFNAVEAVIIGGDPVLGSLIVQVDDADATQVDLVIPFTIVKPLAKFSEVINRFN